MKRESLLRVLVVAAIAAMALAQTPVAFASNGPQDSVQTATAHPSTTVQNSAWLQAKLSYRVVSGIKRGQGKGAHTHPLMLTTPLTASSSPAAYDLGEGGTAATAEPSGGSYTNFDTSWNTTDDKWNNFSDGYYYSLCGPGAADVALYYWPWPPNTNEYDYVPDSMNGNSTSSWAGSDTDNKLRLRGYLLHLGYQIHPPTWSKAGMLPQSFYQTTNKGGATLQTVTDALNYEASGENNSTWSSYFYVTRWNSSFNSDFNSMANTLNYDITTDIGGSHVPVIVEVNTNKLSNWPNSGPGLKHFVAIVGYDNTNGNYKYIDTCKNYTNCNQYGWDATGEIGISQNNLAQAVWEIHTDTVQGDGGWSW